MSRIEAVIFDWAGTTVDYGCFAPVQAFIEAFDAYGIEVLMDEVRKPMGMLKRDHIRTMLQMPRINRQFRDKNGRDFSPIDIDAINSAFEVKLMGSLNKFTKLNPYVQDVVKKIKTMGIKIGSTTGYTDEMMDIVAASAKEGGYEPDLWVTPNQVGSIGRPYPYMIFKIWRHSKCPQSIKLLK